MANITFAVDARELRELRRAAKLSGLALATVARVMTCAVFGVRPSERKPGGPRSRVTAVWMEKQALRRWVMR